MERTDFAEYVMDPSMIALVHMQLSLRQLGQEVALKNGKLLRKKQQNDLTEIESWKTFFKRELERQHGMDYLMDCFLDTNYLSKMAECFQSGLADYYIYCWNFFLRKNKVFLSEEKIISDGLYQKGGDHNSFKTFLVGHQEKYPCNVCTEADFCCEPACRRSQVLFTYMWRQRINAAKNLRVALEHMMVR